MLAALLILTILKLYLCYFLTYKNVVFKFNFISELEKDLTDLLINIK